MSGIKVIKLHNVEIQIADCVTDVIKKAYYPEDLKCHDNAGRCTNLDCVAVAKAYIETNHCERHGKTLYSPEGRLEDEEVKSDIIHLLEELGYKTGFVNKIAEIMTVIKGLADADAPLRYNPDLIPFADGDLDISTSPWTFRKEKTAVVPYRLAVNFPTTDSECPIWRGFLDSLLETEDIKTLQVYLGYALTSSIEAQAALILYGAAGVGKSQVLSVVSAIWGRTYSPIHIGNLGLKDRRFVLTPLNNRLLVGDDDMAQDWIPDTHLFKQLTGSDGQPMEIEYKNDNISSFRPCCKIIGLSNFPPQALHDDTPGFSRKLYPVQVKNRPPHPTGKSIAREMIETELDGIIIWILQGLTYWQKAKTIPLSESTKANQRKIIEERDSLHSFAYQYLVRDANGRVTTEELHQAYLSFCDNESLPRTKNTGTIKAFGVEIKSILERLGGQKVDKVPTKANPDVRKMGWQGFRLP